MIQIEDNDLPITAAQKIIKGVNHIIQSQRLKQLQQPSQVMSILLTLSICFH